MNIKLNEAMDAIAAARKEAKRIEVPMNIAVVDTGGNLVAFARMDDAWLGSVDIAIRKARTSVMFNMETGEIGELSQPGGPLYGIEHSNDGLITFHGGLPIRGGAIGVSGGTVAQDRLVALAGQESAAIPF